MDVADACCEHVDAEVSNHFAFLRVCNFAAADNAVFLAADCADLSLNGDALCMSDADELGGLCDVLFDRIVGTVEHDGREACFDASLSAFVGAVVEVQSNRNRDLQGLQHAVYHANYGVVAAHVLACALGNTEDDRRVVLLSCEQDSLCPFEVIDVELTDSVFACLSLVQHFLCRY